jgi:hypothetical protein
MGGERSADVCPPVCKKMPVGEGVTVTRSRRGELTPPRDVSRDTRDTLIF